MSILNVWNKFEMKNMKIYHNLYLKCDFLLLVDVFEKFRNNSLKNYGVSYISNRYSQANNKYLKSCISKQESKHIYLEANNLYDYAMFI